MAKLEDLGEVISTDVLIVGGSIGGLAAAIKAKEYPVDVLVVDKQTIGWSGKPPLVGGGLWLLAPEDDLDKFVEYNVRNIGDYLNDQELLYSLSRESYGAVEQLAEWGARVTKDAQGKLEISKHRTGLCSLAHIDIDMLLPFRARARKLGVKMLSKVQVVKLLKQDDRVVGAVGFNIIDGRFYIFKAKATILANGSCNYRVERLWSSGCGDGIAAAYGAGAEMRNAEFGNFYDVHCKDTGSAYTSSGFHVNQSYIVNVKGENLFDKYVFEPQPDIAIEFVLGMEKEINEGRGPLYMDMSLATPLVTATSPKLLELGRHTEAKELKYGPPPLTRLEVRLAFNAELSCVRVDHEMKTSLDGLWAIGDTSQEGSAWAGAVFAPRGRLGGTGLMYAAISALRGGPAAARFASKAAPPKINDAEVKRLKKDIFAPVQRQKGLSPAGAISAIQQVVCPVKYNLRRSRDRLEEGLSKIEELKQRLPELWARDTHYLGKCHEAKSMAACAEMTFRSALMRTESRGWHFREDYPERDDKNWLKWVIVKQEDGKMVPSTQPVPIDKYKFRP